MGQRRSISGSRILITGASQGIGRALAVAAARRGARVLAAARSEKLLGELADAVRREGHTIETVVADVTEPACRQRMVEAAGQFFAGPPPPPPNAPLPPPPPLPPPTPP